MAAICLLVLVTLCLRSSDTDGCVDTSLEVQFANEGGQCSGVVCKTWGGVVRGASAIEGERGLEECSLAYNRSDGIPSYQFIKAKQNLRNHRCWGKRRRSREYHSCFVELGTIDLKIISLLVT